MKSDTLSFCIDESCEFFHNNNSIYRESIANLNLMSSRIFFTFRFMV